LLSYYRLSKKPLLFKSFTGFTVQEFDDIYEEIAKKMISMKCNVYQKERIGSDLSVQADLSN
jgi:hypothetical protein